MPAKALLCKTRNTKRKGEAEHPSHGSQTQRTRVNIVVCTERPVADVAVRRAA